MLEEGSLLELGPEAWVHVLGQGQEPMQSQEEEFPECELALWSGTEVSLLAQL
jgi:hypothetical protein